MSAFGYTRYGAKFGAAVRKAGTRISDKLMEATDRLAVALFELGGGNGLEKDYTFLYPFVGGTQVAHSFNLADPSKNRIQQFRTATHNANGVTGPGQVDLFPFEGTTATDAECVWGIYQRSGVSDDNLDIYCQNLIPPAVTSVVHGISSRRATYGDSVYYTGINNASGYMVIANNNSQGFYSAMRYQQYSNAYKNGVNVANLNTGAAGNDGTFVLLNGGNAHNIAYAFLSKRFNVSGFPYDHQLHAYMYAIVQQFQTWCGRAV